MDIFLNSMEERRPLLKRRAYSATSVDLRSHCQRRLACSLVLAIETFERIAFYSLAGNLVLFLNKVPLEWMSYNAVNANFIFMGIGYSMSLLGGFITDRFLGRWLSIVLSFIVYAGGYIMFPLIAYDEDDVPDMCHWHPHLTPETIYNNSNIPPAVIEKALSKGQIVEPCQWLIYLSLTLVAIGWGTVKASIAPFGADQIKAEGEGEVRRFFNWFYWFVNLGSLLALGGVAYIQQSSIGFFYGYIIPVSCLIVALILTVSGKPVFLCREASGSMLTNICKIMREACRSRRRYNKRQKMLRSDVSGGSSDVDVAAAVVRSGGSSSEMQQSISWLDWSKVRYGGSYHESMVEDVKSLGHMMLVFLALVPYWMVYFQIESTFLIQGLHMKLQYSSGANVFQIPVAWLSLFDVIILIFLIPVMDYLVYPALYVRNRLPSLLTRICIGMLFAVIAVTVAGGVETHRLYLVHHNHTFNQTIGNTTYYGADMWVFWQIPQYLLIGVSEAFASVAGLEFAYSQAPRSMRSVTMGLFWVFSGVGSLLGSALMHLVKLFAWINTTYDYGNINHDKLNYYFFLLGSIQLVTLIIFLVVARRYDIGVAGALRVRVPAAPTPAPAPRSTYTRPAAPAAPNVRVINDMSVSRSDTPYPDST